MENSPLNTMRKECPEFCILIAGKSGVGKTTLIKAAFKIETLQISETEPGKCNIDDEIRSPENTGFILHDSQGFEAGETANFEKVKDFVIRRVNAPLIKDRLHAVWLCIQIPVTGARLLEAGDEEFLKLPFVPVIIVLTKYDLLRDQVSFDHLRNPGNTGSETLNDKIEDYYQRTCIQEIAKITGRPKNLKPVRVWVSDSDPKHRHTLEELVDVTSSLIRDKESAWIASTTAQRVNAETNVASCIEVGIRKHWCGPGASAYFSSSRQSLGTCFDVIHGDVVGIWNLRDDNKILQNESFKKGVRMLVQDLAEQSDPEASGLPGPVVSSVSLNKTFYQMLSKEYTISPDVIRCLMGYIIDLILVLEILFWFKVDQTQFLSLSQEDITKALSLYRKAGPRAAIHSQIRSFVKDDMNLEDRTHLEVERLIKANRVLIDTLISQSSPTVETPDSAPALHSSPERPDPGSNLVISQPYIPETNLPQAHFVQAEPPPNNWSAGCYGILTSLIPGCFKPAP